MLDISAAKAFFDECIRAGKGELKKEMSVIADKLGDSFLDIVRAEIISRDIIDTGRLLHSFTKGSSDNVRSTEQKGQYIDLNIGTSVHYAGYVNYGHLQKNSSRWVEGTHFFDNSAEAFRIALPELAENQLRLWLTRFDLIGD